MATTDRLEISRLIHRFGFGPKPGEFAALVAGGVAKARQTVLTLPAVDAGAAAITPPTLSDLGDYLPQKSAALAAFQSARQGQILATQLWWLDRMVSADHGLTERMTWFWHGHWATAVGKVQYALPMYQQNQVLRNTALGNFETQARQMIVDSAMLFWLDGNSNVAKSPNENLAREFMELFTLGVGSYTESHVQTIARALTGYKTVRSAGTVSFNAKQHDGSVLTFLGTTGTFDAPAISDYITSLPANQQYIPHRLWYRFISSSTPLLDQSVIDAFINRDIAATVSALATSKAMSDPRHAQAKAPVDWFVSVCRALGLLPSSLPVNANVVRYLAMLSQEPLNPPNVGGWPADDAWINISSAQTRLSFSHYILQKADLSSLAAIGPTDARIDFLADMLGVAAWSDRTKSVLRTVLSDPQQLVLIAINSPEYVVNA
jgi:uncharacterized protein (DUF1800 family)